MTETPFRVCRQAVITDPLGLHLRPAAKLVSLARSFRSEIRVICQGTMANGKSVLERVTLAAECGTMLDIVAHGSDAEEAVAALTGLIVDGFESSAGRGAAAA
jgi:phosphotransferase system HPr (HPr) family protein